MAARNQGSGGWFELLDDVGPPHTLKGDLETDWIVVGAGCCGLAVAHRLGELRPDDRVALVEAKRVPPEPFLGWVARHRLRRLEAAEAEEL